MERDEEVGSVSIPGLLGLDRRRLCVVLVVSADPVLVRVPFLAAPERDEVEVVVGRVQQVDPAPIVE